MTIEFTEYSKFFIVMFAIMDPIAILPLYLDLAVRFGKTNLNILARTVAISVTVSMLIALFIGSTLLDFFGISIGSFRIAGGILLFLMAWQLMSQSPQVVFSTEKISLDTLRSQAVVPLAIPLLAGPGAFSTVIVYSQRHDDLQHMLLMALCLLLIGLLTYIVLKLAQKIAPYLSNTALAVLNKVMGLIMAAIAVEFIGNGIKDVFHLT